MTKHTPEPWYRSDERSFTMEGVSADRGGMQCVILRGNYNFADAQANEDRAIACVNALAGIEDPTKFVAYAKAAIAAIELWNNPDAQEDDVTDAMILAVKAKPKPKQEQTR